MSRMRRDTTPASVLAGWFVCAGVVRPGVDAQTTERQRDIQRPSIGVSPKAEWQLHVHDGYRFAAPVSWHVDADGSLATAPDGSQVSVRLFRIANWSAHKAKSEQRSVRCRSCMRTVTDASGLRSPRSRGCSTMSMSHKASVCAPG